MSRSSDPRRCLRNGRMAYPSHRPRFRTLDPFFARVELRESPDGITVISVIDDRLPGDVAAWADLLDHGVAEGHARRCRPTRVPTARIAGPPMP